MKVYIGESGLERTWQKTFKKTTKCIHCGKNSRIAFVAYEHPQEEPCERIMDLHENMGGDGGNYWPHDCTAFATYLCTKCLKATTIFNQA